MKLGNGHQAIQPIAIGRTRYDAAKKMVVHRGHPGLRGRVREPARHHEEHRLDQGGLPGSEVRAAAVVSGPVGPPAPGAESGSCRGTCPHHPHGRPDLRVVAVRRRARADPRVRRPEDPQHRPRQPLRRGRLCGRERRRRCSPPSASRRPSRSSPCSSPRVAVALVLGPAPGARPAAPVLRPRRGRAPARHLRPVPHPRGRGEADLGRQPLLRLRALRALRQRRRSGRCSMSATTSPSSPSPWSAASRSGSASTAPSPARSCSR